MLIYASCITSLGAEPVVVASLRADLIEFNTSLRLTIKPLIIHRLAFHSDWRQPIVRHHGTQNWA